MGRCSRDAVIPNTMAANQTTPTHCGFYMPAEWHPHEATWLAWPHNPITWQNRTAVEQAYVEIIKALHTGEKVHLLVNDDTTKQRVMPQLAKAKINCSQIVFFKIPTADGWVRDYGPTFLLNSNGELGFAKWTFNAWGGKYDDLLPDNTVPDEINKILKLPCFTAGIILEGGSIDVNGQGLVLTTKQCLLNKNRNPLLSQKEIEKYLKDYLNVHDVLWLNKGVAGDDTDGHIDDIARFVNPSTVVCSYADRNDENFEVLHENYEILQTYAQKYNLTIVKLPHPHYTDHQGLPLPASYANFLIANAAVLVPVFNDSHDTKALNIIRNCFPAKNVVGIDARKLVEGFGAIHCLSQQQPTAKK